MGLHGDSDADTRIDSREVLIGIVDTVDTQFEAPVAPRLWLILRHR